MTVTGEARNKERIMFLAWEEKIAASPRTYRTCTCMNLLSPVFFHAHLYTLKKRNFAVHEYKSGEKAYVHVCIRTRAFFFLVLELELTGIRPLYIID